MRHDEFWLVKSKARTERRLVDELPDLLAQSRAADGEEAPSSLRALAAAIGVNQSYLSRVLESERPDARKAARPVSKDVAGRIAVAFGKPLDYFPEWRAATVIEAARANPALLDPIYEKL